MAASARTGSATTEGAMALSELESAAVAAGLEIRLATPKDNPALLALSSACPMQADISLAIERDPDFFALSRARGSGRTYVAESGGRVVACGGVCRRPAYVLGEPAEMGYVGDFKVLPSFRGHGLAQRILAAIVADERDAPPAPYVGSIAAGNAATDRMVRRIGRSRNLTPVGAFASYQLLPFFRPRVASRFDIGAAETRDEAELIELLDGFHRPRSFAPVFREGGLRRLLDASPGMRLGDYRIARHRGRIVAAAAVWDAFLVKHTRVCRLTRGLRWLSRLVRAAGTVASLPPLPAEGELLRSCYIRHAACVPGAYDALAAVIRSIVCDAAAHRQHFALFTCAAGDPLAGCLRGIPRTTYQYALVAGTNALSWAPRLSALAGAPRFDDAAVA
jgi:GNAT superfamily N-acetyltransferase